MKAGEPQTKTFLSQLLKGVRLYLRGSFSKNEKWKEGIA